MKIITNENIELELPEEIVKQFPPSKAKNEKQKFRYGDTVKKMTVLYRIDKKDHTTYLLRCICGNYKTARSDHLINNKVGLCPECQKRERLIKSQSNEIGQRFGTLTIIDYFSEQYIEDNKKKYKYYVKVRCDCGAEEYLDPSRLHRGEVITCYKERKIPENLIGKQFDALTVLKKSEKTQTNGISYWECKCQCGNIVLRTTKTLRNQEHYHSCGCHNIIRSYGEEEISKLLIQHNYTFIHDKPYFSDLRLPSGIIGRYDFIILNNNIPIRLIEFDGIQHYQEYRPGYGKTSLIERQERDKIKDEYARKHNIPLVRIPYYERGKITLELLFGDKYLINK